MTHLHNPSLHNEKHGLSIEPNHKFPGWWTLYDRAGKPITSSTSYLRVKAHFDAIMRDVEAEELLDLQCEAEFVHHYPA